MSTKMCVTIYTYYFGVLRSRNVSLTSNTKSEAFIPGSLTFTWVCERERSWDYIEILIRLLNCNSLLFGALSVHSKITGFCAIDLDIDFSSLLPENLLFTAFNPTSKQALRLPEIFQIYHFLLFYFWKILLLCAKL